MVVRATRVPRRVEAPQPSTETASATAMEVIKGTSTSMMAKAALVHGELLR